MEQDDERSEGSDVEAGEEDNLLLENFLEVFDPALSAKVDEYVRQIFESDNEECRVQPVRRHRKRSSGKDRRSLSLSLALSFSHSLSITHTHTHTHSRSIIQFSQNNFENLTITVEAKLLPFFTTYAKSCSLHTTPQFTQCLGQPYRNLRHFPVQHPRQKNICNSLIS